MTTAKRKRALKDIGDTALLLCGCFGDSLKSKIIDLGFYEDLGAVALNEGLERIVLEVEEKIT